MMNIFPIEGFLELIQDPVLKKMSYEYFEILKKRGFDEAPASCAFHHNYKGGLRDHTQEMLSIGASIATAMNMDVNRDELIISIIFHDAGKADLYKLLPDGRYVHNTESRAYVVDHSIVPIEDWRKLNMNFPKTVEYSILAHMGGWSKTGIYPDTILSAIVHSADLLSSRIGECNWS